MTTRGNLTKILSLSTISIPISMSSPAVEPPRAPSRWLFWRRDTANLREKADLAVAACTIALEATTNMSSLIPLPGLELGLMYLQNLVITIQVGRSIVNHFRPADAGYWLKCRL